MKSIEKLKIIEEKILLLNDNVFKTKKWKLQFVNKGVNKYCLTFVLNDAEIFCAKYNTYDDLLNTLLLLEFMFKISKD